MRLAADFERSVGADALPRLVEAPLAGEDKPRHNESLGGRACFCQPAFDQCHIQPRLAHRFPHSQHLLAWPA